MVYVFAIIGMICWGVSPIFAKLGLRQLPPLVGLSIRTLFTTIVIFIWMFFNGSIVELRTIPAKTIMYLVAEAFLATLIGDLAYFAALKQGSPSIVMLIMACSPLVTILCSMIFLNDKLSFVNSIGAGLIIIGIFLLI